MRTRNHLVLTGGKCVSVSDKVVLFGISTGHLFIILAMLIIKDKYTKRGFLFKVVRKLSCLDCQINEQWGLHCLCIFLQILLRDCKQLI